MSKYSAMRGNDYNRDREQERMNRATRRANRERRTRVRVANREDFR